MNKTGLFEQVKVAGSVRQHGDKGVFILEPFWALVPSGSLALTWGNRGTYLTAGRDIGDLVAAYLYMLFISLLVHDPLPFMLLPYAD